MRKTLLLLLMVATTVVYAMAITAPDKLYMVGTVNYTSYSTLTPVEMTKDGNTFKIDKVTVNQTTAGSGIGYFAFTTSKGASWANVTQTPRFGALSDGAYIMPGMNVSMKGFYDTSSAPNFWKLDAPYDYQVVADFTTMTLKVTEIVYPKMTFEPSAPLTNTLYRGESVQIPLTNLSADPMISAQFNLEVPEGMTITGMKLSEKMPNHSIAYNCPNNDGKYIVTIISLSNKTFDNSVGDFCTITLSANENITPGAYQVKMSNITACDVNMQSVHTADYNINVMVPNVPQRLYIVGMVNNYAWDTSRGVSMTRDGSVYKAEMVRVQKSGPTATTGSFLFTTKLNDDWAVVRTGDRYVASSDGQPLTSGVPCALRRIPADNTTMVEYSWTIPAPEDYDIEVDFSAMTVTATKHVYPATPCQLNVPNVNVSPGKTTTMSMNMLTPDPMAGFQWDLRLPEGITVVDATLTKSAQSHSVGYSYVADEGVYRFIIYSLSNATIGQDAGVFLNITLSAAEDMALGDYQAQFVNVKSSNIYLKLVEIDDITPTISVVAVPVNVELDRSQLALQLGESATLTATVTPVDLPDKTVTWSSSNESVATVSSTGVVTGAGVGTAVVTATCGNGSATCTVTVGKTSQEIIWDQDLNASLLIGDQITLTATASSGLPVTYEIIEGVDCARIVDGNKVEALALGDITVEARQMGDDTYAPAEPVTKVINVWRGYLMGDVDGNGKVELADITTAVNYYLDASSVANFRFAAADMNGNGSLDSSDISMIIEIVLNAGAKAPAQVSPMARAGGNSTKEQFSVTADAYTMTVRFTNMQDYIACQFDLALEPGVEVKYALYAGGTDHEVHYTKIDENIYRFIVISMTNKPFSAGGAIYIGFNRLEGDFALDHCVVNKQDPSGNTVDVPALGYTSVPTGIEAVEADAAAEVEYYNLQGVRVVNPGSGIYIRRQGSDAKVVRL